MPTNAQGLYASVDDLPPEVHTALGGHPHALRTWRAAYNAAAGNPKYSGDAPFAVAWAAVGGRHGRYSPGKKPGEEWHRNSKPPAKKVFSWLPMNKRRQLDDDEHDSSQAGRDDEVADPGNPNAVSPMMAEAASVGWNTTDPEEDTPEDQTRGVNRQPIAKPKSPGNPPAAI